MGPVRLLLQYPVLVTGFFVGGMAVAHYVPRLASRIFGIFSNSE